MSLNEQQIADTRRELAVNVARISLEFDEIARALDISPDRVSAAIGLIEPVDSVDVWAVRDLIEIVARRTGLTLLPFSALTEEVRPRAEVWFPLRRITASTFDVIADTRNRPPTKIGEYHT